MGKCRLSNPRRTKGPLHHAPAGKQRQAQQQRQHQPQRVLQRSCESHNKHKIATIGKPTLSHQKDCHPRRGYQQEPPSYSPSWPPSWESSIRAHWRRECRHRSRTQRGSPRKQPTAHSHPTRLQPSSQEQQQSPSSRERQRRQK